jgi:DNA polymerase III subunit alpha
MPVILPRLLSLWKNAEAMGIKVLGPDVNESKKGFAPNMKGEIRFGLGGLKGVGEAAIESLIEERTTNGRYLDVYDFVTRVNQRTVNKKSFESLVYSGAFDGFPEYHRAQYFAITKGEKESGLEKIIKYGNIMQQQSQTSVNTLFGNLQDSVQIQKPKILPCEPWTLTELLEHEKDVTGMFMSGHPLDHFSFELKHYGILPVSDITYLMTDEDAKPSVNRSYKISGLVTAAQERTTKTGKNFGNLTIEDYSGKLELTMWSNDYARFSPFFKTGLTLYIVGNIKPKMRYNGPEQVQDGWEFKVTQIQMLESLRQQQTKAVEINIHPADVKPGMIDFLAGQVKKNNGQIGLKLKLRDREKNYEIELNGSKGIQLSDELTQFLMEHQEIETKVITPGDN